MSAIAGVVRFDGAATAREAVQMAAKMRRRGPDTDAAWADGPVAFGYRGLHTTLESIREEIPLVRGPFALVADARIDDRDALADRLASTLRALGLPAEERPLSDADLLLAAYAEWGDNCADRILGDFAFAVWDSKRQRLFCAKDPFGTRPLYYTHRPGGTFAFASSTEALRAFAPDYVDQAFLADRLLGYSGDPARTALPGVQSLLGGHALSIDPRGLQVWQHFSLRPARGIGAGWSSDDYAAGFRERFETSVRDRSRSAFPVGADLSGGLDSSAVVAVARDVLRDEGRGPLHTFSTIHSDTPELDEREYIQAVIDQGGVVAHFLEASELSPIATLDEAVPTVGDDLLLGAHFTMWGNLKAGAAAGVRTVLSGYDGDSVVLHGRARLRELADAGDWEGFGRESRALAARYSRASHRQPFEESLASADQLFLEFGVGALDQAAEDLRPWEFWQRLLSAEREVNANRRGLTRRVWRRALTPRPLLRMTRARQAARPGGLSERSVELAARFLGDAVVQERVALAESQVSTIGFRSVRGDHIASLERLSLGVTAGLFQLLAGACGLEVAHPFFDRRLVEYSLALPADQKLRDGWTRFVQRKAFEDVLPASVAWRVGKANFAPAFHRAWFEIDSERGQDLLDHPGDAGNVIDLETLRHRVDNNAAGTLDEVGGTALGLTLVHWLRTQGTGGDGEATAPPDDTEAAAPPPNDDE